MPPPVTSIVLPVKVASLSEPVTRIWRRPPRSATKMLRYVNHGESSGLVVAPLAYPSAELHHEQQRATPERRHPRYVNLDRCQTGRLTDGSAPPGTDDQILI
jgi:hypothetical protein